MKKGGKESWQLCWINKHDFFQNTKLFICNCNYPIKIMIRYVFFLLPFFYRAMADKKKFHQSLTILRKTCI